MLGHGGAGRDTDEVRREGRWQPALALLLLITLPLLFPHRLTWGYQWVFATILAVFLAAIVAVDLSRVGRRAALVRVLAVGLTVTLILGAASVTLHLAHQLTIGAPETVGDPLLATGALVWLNNNTIFGLLC